MSLSDPSIITLFRNVSPSSRHAFLSALSSQFHPSDWHHIHHLLHKNAYYVDLIPLLPLEISLQILRYLPLKELLPLRFVSHRWNTLLRSPEVCRSLTHHFFPRRNTDKHLDPVALFENLASRRLAFMGRRMSKLGTFSTYDPNEWDDGRSEDDSSEDAYRVDIHPESSRMAWVQGGNSIEVRNLLNLQAPTVLPQTYMDDRCSIGEVVLSGSVVAAVSTTMGVCQVWDLETQATHSFKLPGAIVATLHSDGNIIAILLHRKNLDYQLVVHNAATRKTKCIDIACQEQYNGNQLIVDEASNRVVHVKFFVAGKLDIELTSWSIDTGKTLEILTQPVETIRELRKFQPVGNGCWVIKAYLTHDHNTMHISHLQLDLTQTKLSIISKPYEVSINGSMHADQDLQMRGGMELGTCGTMTWTMTAHDFSSDSTTGLIWDEVTLQMSPINSPSFRRASSRPFWPGLFVPWYFDPYNRCALWGSIDGNHSWGYGEGVPEGRGFESSSYIVEEFYGIHEKP